MNVFDLIAKISLDTQDYEKSLGDAEKKTSSFSSSLGSGVKKAAKVGAAAVGAITAASSLAAGAIYKNAKASAQYGDSVDKMSQKVGMSAEAYQEWDYVMQISGTEMASMTTGLKTLTNKFDEAKSGTKSSVEMFEKLGLSMEDIKDLSREDLFGTVISQFQQMEDSTERAALANDFFGRSGQELIPLFNTTVEETQKLKKEARDYGAVMSNDAVKASATFNDRLTRMSKAMSGVKNTISSNFLPGLTQIIEGFSDVIEGNETANDALGEGFTKTIDAFADNVPKFLEVGGRIISSLADGIIRNIPKFAKTGLDIIVKIADYVIKALPKLAESAVQIIGEISKGISEALPTLIPKAAEAITTIVRGLIQHGPELIKGAIEVFKGLAQGLILAIPMIIKEIPTLIKELITSIADNFGASALAILPAAFAVVLGKALIGGLTAAAGTSGLSGAVTAMFTGPQGIVSAVAAGAVVLSLAVKNSFDEAYETAREEASKLTDSQQKIIDKIHEEAQKWDEIKESRLEAAKNVDETVGSYKELWDRLTEIVDEQGKVKKGYEEEAKYIQGELSTAMGIEFDFQDGQIKNYKEIRNQIDLTIAKKKAELMLRAFEDDYVKAQKKRVEATEAQSEAESELQKALRDQKAAEDELKRAQDKLNEAKAFGAGSAAVYGKSISEMEEEVHAAEGTLKGITERIETWSTALDEADLNVKESQRTIENYDRATNAAAHGGIEEIDEALTYMTRSMKTATNASENELREQTAAFVKEWKTQSANAKKYGDEFSRQEAASAKKAVDASIKEMEKLSPNVAKQIKAAIKAGQDLKPNWINLGENAAKGIGSGFKGATTYVTNAAKNTIKDAISAAKKVALIASPSKLFRDEIGLNLGKGIAVGLEDAESDVRNASSNLIEAAADVGDYEYETTAVDLGEQTAGSIVINVYGAEGQDIRSLADEVADRLQRMYKREVATFA